MNKLKMAGLITVFLSLLGVSALLHAANQIVPPDVTPELISKGRELFNHKEGLKVKFACILCHQQEKAIKKVNVEKLGDKLPVIINKHIIEKSKGQAVPADSPDMKALMAYIRYEHSK